MLFCGGECGLEWYLPAFFPRPVTPTQLNPASVFRTQLQWESSRRTTPLLVASLTLLSVDLRGFHSWSCSHPESIFCDSTTTVLRAHLLYLSEQKTFLCRNIKPHKQALCFPWGMAPLGFYSCVPPPKQVCQVSQRAMLATFLLVIMVTPLCGRNLKTFSWTVSNLSW